MASRKNPTGKFKSERQRRFMWANVPRAARKWAHGIKTTKSDWSGRRSAKKQAKRQAKRRRK